jgi:hypothetical protein
VYFRRVFARYTTFTTKPRKVYVWWVREREREGRGRETVVDS